jgi:8-oxo-dGTP pyrophosphatase MutT (NUDIX family)
MVPNIWSPTLLLISQLVCVAGWMTRPSSRGILVTLPRLQHDDRCWAGHLSTTSTIAGTPSLRNTRRKYDVKHYPSPHNARSKMRLNEVSSEPNETTVDSSTTDRPNDQARLATLAGDYLVEIVAHHQDNNHLFTWSLFPIEQVVDGMEIVAAGEQAKQALLLPTIPVRIGDKTTAASRTKTNTTPSLILKCRSLSNGHLQVTSRSNFNEPDDLRPAVSSELRKLLIRILAQWGASSLSVMSASPSNKNTMEWTVILQGDRYCDDDDDDDDNLIASMDLSSNQGLEPLFQPLSKGDGDHIEWVEMVTGNGAILGRVPRRLVHTFNLLHRGIGVFVTKDTPLLGKMTRRNHNSNSHEGDNDVVVVNNTSFPDLYCHRRTDTKRIFPSLYDMFVGGVSLAEEVAELTARREVAEELGLSRALEEDAESSTTGGTGRLSQPLLNCVVCTAYNRCLVTLFSYVCHSNEEPITWQEEEVAWGGFLPYPVIAAAADRSIQRLVTRGTWPGAYPPIQSQWKGSLPPEYDQPTTSQQQPYQDWDQWDFVPDGLLVWDAWLTWLQEQDSK